MTCFHRTKKYVAMFSRHGTQKGFPIKLKIQWPEVMSLILVLSNDSYFRDLVISMNQNLALLQKYTIFKFQHLVILLNGLYDLKLSNQIKNQKVLFKVGTFYNNQHKLSRAFQTDIL